MNTPIPLEASADSKKNAHTMFCKAVGQHMHYVVCITRLAGADPRDSMCQKNVGTSACKAHLMREEELAKGKAIYFWERTPFTGVSALVDKAKALFKPTVHVGPVPEPTPMPNATGPVPVVDYMAAALNTAVTEHLQKAPPAKPTAKIEVRPGETLLEAARRMRAEQTPVI